MSAAAVCETSRFPARFEGSGCRCKSEGLGLSVYGIPQVVAGDGIPKVVAGDRIPQVVAGDGISQGDAEHQPHPLRPAQERERFPLPLLPTTIVCRALVSFLVCRFLPQWRAMPRAL